MQHFFFQAPKAYIFQYTKLRDVGVAPISEVRSSATLL